jgi:hypothetical protein
MCELLPKLLFTVVTFSTDLLTGTLQQHSGVGHLLARRFLMNRVLIGTLARCIIHMGPIAHRSGV